MLGGHINLVGDFTECVFDESLLQLRLRAFRPCAQDGLDDLDLATVFQLKFFVADGLSYLAHCVEGARPAVAVNSCVALCEWDADWHLFRLFWRCIRAVWLRIDAPLMASE